MLSNEEKQKMHEDAPEGYFTIIQNPLRQEQITQNQDTHLEYTLYMHAAQTLAL